MITLLKFLDDLAYVFESVACDYTGEGKTELSRLCDKLQNGEYKIEERAETLAKCNAALELYYERHYHEGSRILSQISRELWRKISE
jgi:hypothetical protein